ncbi:MAG: hypothetical protein ACXVLM_06300 [Ilumatobacteraceae bacterium]
MTPVAAAPAAASSFPTPAPGMISSAPMLPPVVDPHEPEPLLMPVVTRAYEHTQRSGPDVLGTSAPRLLAEAGWLGGVICYTIAAVVLSKSYRHITADNWRLALDQIHWLVPVTIASFGLAYVGWVVWTTLASINAHRVAPLASSPWLPPAAYLLGPVAAFAGSIYKPGADRFLLAGGIAWVCIGHGLVLVSLRSSARRIGGDSEQFTRLIWFPLASIGYRAIATIVLPDTSFDNSWTFAALVVVDVMLMVATALAVWRAMHAFDQACARDRYSAVENQLPAFMASAHH